MANEGRVHCDRAAGRTYLAIPLPSATLGHPIIPERSLVLILRQEETLPYGIDIHQGSLLPSGSAMAVNRVVPQTVWVFVRTNYCERALRCSCEASGYKSSLSRTLLSSTSSWRLEIQPRQKGSNGKG